MIEQILPYQHYFIALSLVSLLIFVVSLLIMPYLVREIPQNYFTKSYVSSQSYWLVKFGKNILGWTLLLLGLIMLVTPGQGIITILFSLFLIDFPKKRQIELALINQDKAFNGLNWLRQRGHCKPLQRDKR